MSLGRIPTLGRSGIAVVVSAVIALFGVSITCPLAHAGAPAEPISVPAPQLLNPNDTPAHEDKAQTLDPDDDDDDLYTHWGDPVVILEGQRQIFYMVLILGAAAGASAVRRTILRKAAKK
jgi:hypothetical protein